MRWLRTHPLCTRKTSTVLEAVARANAESFEGLAEDGLAIIPQDSPYRDILRPPTGATGLAMERGGVDRAPWLDPPDPKKGSIDGTPKIPPRLTPGPRR